MERHGDGKWAFFGVVIAALIGAPWILCRWAPGMVAEGVCRSITFNYKPADTGSEDNDSENTRNRDCETERAGFPQDEEAARTTYGLPDSSRVTMEDYRGCATGFVLRGLDPVTLDVPRGGCIDVDPHAVITGASRPNPGDPDGIRATSGSVHTNNLTYWYSCNE